MSNEQVLLRTVDDVTGSDSLGLTFFRLQNLRRKSFLWLFLLLFFLQTIFFCMPEWFLFALVWEKSY